jgi:hypothetical protein
LLLLFLTMLTVLRRYNFFLDEMIAIHNEHIVFELRSQGHAPHIQSESLLLGGFPFVSGSAPSATMATTTTAM